MEWKFENRAFVAESVGEINVVHNKLVLALAMLDELGHRAEFDRLADKFIKEKSESVEPLARSCAT